MPVIPDKCEFTLDNADQLQFHTQTNGDSVTMVDMRLSKEMSACMAWLANSNEQLRVEIKSTGIVVPNTPI